MPQRFRPSVAAIAMVTAGIVACEEPVQQQFPEHAIPMAAQAQYAFWWLTVEQCSGTSGDLAAIRWYTMPKGEALPDSRADYPIIGEYWPDGNRIVLNYDAQIDGGAVRHEMLHALINQPGHPLAYFADKCGGLVRCEECALGEPPANAPHVDASTLDIRVRAYPTEVTDATSAGWMTIQVSVTNPSSQARWVDLHDPHFVGFPGYEFGYTTTSPSYPYSSPGEQEGSGITTIGFQPGETKSFSFDIHLPSPATSQPDVYEVLGMYNGYYTSSSVTVTRR